MVRYAMMLGKLPVSGRPTNLENSRERPTSLAIGAGGGVWTFICRLSSLFLSLTDSLI